MELMLPAHPASPTPAQPTPLCRVFGSWLHWAPALVSMGYPTSPLIHCLHSAACEAGQAGHLSAQVFEAACMAHISFKCRTWLSAKHRVPSDLVTGITHNLCADIAAAAGGHGREEVWVALARCVDAAIRLWVLLKAAHPLLQPLVTPVGGTAEGATVLRRVPCLEGEGAGVPLVQGQVVLASLCPAAAFVGSSLQPGGAAEGGPQVLVAERVVLLEVVGRR